MSDNFTNTQHPICPHCMHMDYEYAKGAEKIEVGAEPFSHNCPLCSEPYLLSASLSIVFTTDFL